MPKKIIDFVLPPLCPVTGEMVGENGMVSAKFWQELSFIHDPLCKRCGAPFAFDTGSDAECGLCLDHPPSYNKGRSALAYNDASREIILKFKHGDQTHAVKSFTPWLLQAGKELFQQSDIIIPIPLHPLRLIKRRYNQAELMARELHHHLPELHYLPDGLKRIKSTQSQGHKKKSARQKNVSNAFDVPQHHLETIKGQSILIIDDVLTTGATVNECTRVLLNNGASNVNVLTLARVVND